MKTLLAAIDDSRAAESVLMSCSLLAGGIGADTHVIHVADEPVAHITDLARSHDYDVEFVSGEPAEAIIEVASHPDVICVIMGLRRDQSGPRPIGSIAKAVCEGSHRPVVVVPPEADWSLNVVMKRALVPLNGSEEASQAFQRVSQIFTDSQIELIPMHVFHRGSMPLFWDASRRDLDEWAQEFVTHHVDQADAELQVRRGTPGRQVLDVGEAAKVDLIVLEWAQQLTPDRADVVREVLSRTTVPVLLVPLESTG